MAGSGNDGKPKAVIPTIDLLDFPAQSKKLVEACEEWGCFRVVNHDHILPASLMEEMKEMTKSLFDLPKEIKKRNKDNVLVGSGYVAPTFWRPLYEALGLYDMTSPHDVERFFNDLDLSPHQREIIVKYGKGVEGVMREVMKQLCEAVGVKREQHVDEWCWQLRLNKYHFTPEGVGSPGVPIHTDAGFLTLLQDDESVGGLEVISRSGEVVVVDPVPGCLLLNLGDVAVLWSNGRFCNTRHSVMCRQGSVRYSIVSFFLGPKEGVAVEPQPEFVDPTHPPMYLPATYFELRKFRMENNMHDGEVLELVRAPAPAATPAEPEK
ncbi:hypothetical protein DM860_004025 [Cuscuta australis]|uniref:feruloyl-CoA 6-hydroxylase n=1 Tax=Cuscuta australis TaxID=267555 RepID=A0A328CZQ5_9ASTE|nr:hypothetical protein DM860_004025 [Cuscuta australis]